MKEDNLFNILKLKILFGHQTIGYTIIEGIKEVLAGSGAILSITESDIVSPDKPGLFHFKAGQSRNPISKIDAFSSAVRRAARNKVDIAFIKFCLTDITVETDINILFNYYKTIFNQLTTEFPGITFIHFTLPLAIIKSDPVSRIKNNFDLFFRKKNQSLDDNIKRNDFNEILINQYKGKEPVFDLANIQASSSDGGKKTFLFNKKHYLAMSDSYANPSGFLNEKGRKWVAEKFIDYLTSEIR